MKHGNATFFRRLYLCLFCLAIFPALSLFSRQWDTVNVSFAADGYTPAQLGGVTGFSFADANGAGYTGVPFQLFPSGGPYTQVHVVECDLYNSVTGAILLSVPFTDNGSLLTVPGMGKMSYSISTAGYMAYSATPLPAGPADTLGSVLLSGLGAIRSVWWGIAALIIAIALVAVGIRFTRKIEGRR